MSDNYEFSTFDQDGNILKLQFLSDTQGVREKCRLGYAQSYKYYFENNVMTRAQAMELGKQNGILDDSWEEELEKCTQELMQLRIDLDKEKSKKRPPKKKIDALYEQSKKVYKRYQELSQRQSDILGSTCESMAENRELELCVALRCADPEGNLVFKDHEDLVKRSHEAMVQDAIEHMLFWRMRLPYRMKGLFPGEEELVTESGSRQ